MSATHNGLITNSVTLVSPPGTAAGFGGVCLVTDSSGYAGPDDPLDGADVAKYTTTSQVAEALAGGQIDATAAYTLTAALDIGAAAVYIADFDGASEDPGDAIGRALASSFASEIFVYVPEETSSTADADSGGGAVDILTAINALSGEDKLLIYQQSNTTTPVAAHTDIERVAGVYHDVTPSASKTHQGYMWAVSRAIFNPDETSAGWKGAIPTGEPYSTPITQTVKDDTIEAGGLNTVLPFGPELTYLAPGQNSEGKPLDHVVTKFWFRTRLRERLVNLILAYDARGRKIPLNASGQALIEGEIEAQYDLGVQAGHFETDQLVVTFPTITAGDISAQRLRVTVEIQLVTGVIQFDLTTYLSTTEVV